MAQYEILRSLDRGGMAEVFLARLVGVEGFEKRVVLKRVLPHLSGNPSLLARFVDEARVAARLSHPNIVQIFELGEQHGQYFIAMEHVDGRNLKDVAKRLFARGERIPVEHAVRIGGAVLDALHYAHTRTDDEGRPVELVHRDVSPSNVLVSFEGVVKLIDFGIARHTERVERTSPGTVVGKAGYMSPEQMRGERVDARTDVFACAATLFHVVTGVLPFPGIGVAAVMHAVNHGERRSYEEVRETIDEDLFAVLSKGFAHRPEERFQSAREMQKALEVYAAARGIMGSTAALSELMRETFVEGDDDEGAPIEPETQSRVVTLGHGGFTQLPSSGSVSVATETQTREKPKAPLGWASVLAAVAGMALLGGMAAWWVVGASSGDEGLSALSSTPSSAAVGPRAGESASTSSTPSGPSAASSPEVASASEAQPEPEARPASEATFEPTSEPAPEREPMVLEELALAVAPSSASSSSAPSSASSASSSSAAAKARGEARRGATKRAPASLTLDSDPWSEVSVDGKRVGLTPIHALELPAGRHVIHLSNPERKVEKKLTVTLRAGESRRMRLALE